MINNIEKFRAEIEKDFNEDTFQKGDFEKSISPSGNFRMEATNFWSKEPNWDLSRVRIFDHRTNEKLFEFFVNESQSFYGWLSNNGIEYLVCAEDIFGGQTIIDLTKRVMSSYSPGEDGFIWTDFFLSPNGKLLATLGCYWACNTYLKIFDFSEPLNLPLREIKEFELLGNDEIILGWKTDSELQMKGIKRVIEPEYFEGGSMRWKIISETPIERIIEVL